MFMIRSMTGFGRCETEENNRRVTVEMRSVNNRYLDLSVKMPRKFGAFEAAVRAEVKKYLARGKVDLYISYEDFSAAGNNIRYNRDVAAEYMDHFRAMAEDFGIDNDIRVSSLARFPEVFTLEETELDEETVWELIRKTVDGALEKMAEERAREGNFLKEDLLAKLDEMSDAVGFIGARSPEIISGYQAKLVQKVKDLLGDTARDESRILQEVTIYADKICVDEEMVRLKSHIGAMREALNTGADEGVGRRLDFLAQEMNREANTILSKSGDVDISDKGIVLKTVIEKIREQIQNIE